MCHRTFHAALSRLSPRALVLQVSALADVPVRLADASEPGAADVGFWSSGKSLTSSLSDLFSLSHSLRSPVIGCCVISLHLHVAVSALVRDLKFSSFPLFMF